ncbi:FadR/GntR family transcriptional regulator [uncultured Eubacterium sp.]|uniref:FadR/GntR family transcriptional regulator n=1 Tax=uncultured Eubacterium sp. TaxID=165185 RepID=UPI0025D3908A|nr:FadR/GntR family transcriptional regulator [uncultured Eubacterium sp.]
MKNVIQIDLQPVQTKRASEEIYNQIRQLIFDGEIHPGERLPSERKMMEMMHRSRPTIREAMRMLEREGYIKIYSGSSGAVVQEINVDNAVQSLETIIQMKHLSIENILEYRRQTENEAARLAAIRRTEKDLEKMKEIVQRSEAAIGNPEEFMECDMEFHVAVAEASQNSMYSIMLQVCRNVLGESLTQILNQGKKSTQKVRYELILDVHKKIYIAVKNQKEEDAAKWMTTHLINAEHDILP